MPSRALNQLSDLFFAIEAAIAAAGLGVKIENYEDFDGTVSDSTVLIEIERTAPAVKQNDGRYAHQVTITLHGVIARKRPHAVLEAANLATMLERLVDDNRWGLPGAQCDLPTDMHSAPSIFQRGADGYEAWGCNFRQSISIGTPRAMPETFWPQPSETAEVWQIETPADA